MPAVAMMHAAGFFYSKFSHNTCGNSGVFCDLLPDRDGAKGAFQNAAVKYWGFRLPQAG